MAYFNINSDMVSLFQKQLIVFYIEILYIFLGTFVDLMILNNTENSSFKSFTFEFFFVLECKNKINMCTMVLHSQNELN